MITTTQGNCDDHENIDAILKCVNWDGFQGIKSDRLKLYRLCISTPIVVTMATLGIHM